MFLVFSREFSNLQEETASIGDAEKYLMRRKDALMSGLATLLVRKKVKSVDELLDHSQIKGILIPPKHIISMLLLLAFELFFSFS